MCVCVCVCVFEMYVMLFIWAYATGPILGKYSLANDKIMVITINTDIMILGLY